MKKGLIINADDFGLTPDTNRAVWELARGRTLSSTSVMSNMPHAEEIRQVKESVPGLGVGVHLTLTSGRPVLAGDLVPSLVDSNGGFHSLKELLRRAKRGKVVLSELRSELEAQVRRANGWLNGGLDHWDSHEGFHRFEPFASVCLSVCRREGLRAMRSHRHYFITCRQPLTLLRPGLGNLGTFGWGRFLRETYYGLLSWRASRSFALPTGLLALVKGSTLEILQIVLSGGLPSGTWEIACHPAASNAGLSEAELLQARVGEFELLSSEPFRRVVGEGRLGLISFGSLVR